MPKLDLPKQFIIFDTEYTSWEGAKQRDWTGPNEHRELVQIGALKVTYPALEVIDEYQELLIPEINPELSDYFTNLTHITPAQLDQHGHPPRDIIKKFAEWSEDLPLYSYGHDDAILEENCQLLGIPCPIASDHFHNIKEIFITHGIDADSYMSSTIVKAFGEKPTRPGHDALNDAHTIVDGLRLLSSSSPPPSSEA